MWDLFSEVKDLETLKKIVENQGLGYEDIVNYLYIYLRDIKDIHPKLAALLLRAWFDSNYTYVETDIRVIEKLYYDIYGHNFSWFDNPDLLIVITGGKIFFKTNSEEIFKKGDIILRFIMDPDRKKLKLSERKAMYLRIERYIIWMKNKAKVEVMIERILDKLATHWHNQEFKYLELDIWKIKKLINERLGFNLYWLDEDTIVTYSSKGIINFTRSYQYIDSAIFFVIKKVEPSITEDIKEREKKKGEEKNEKTDEETTDEF